MKRLTRRFSTLALLLIPALLLTNTVSAKGKSTLLTGKAKDTGNCYLWEVSPKKGKGKVYLLGSIHFGDKTMYPMNETIEEAYAASQIACFELDLTDPMVKSKLASMQMTKGLLPGKETLKQVLSKRVYNKLKTHLAKYGLDIVNLHKAKPWYIAFSLVAREIIFSGYSPMYGIDHHFMTRAQLDNKPVIGLETPESQIDSINNMNRKEQEIFLEGTLDHLGEAKQALPQFLDAWNKGDGERILQLTMEEVSQTPEFAKVFYDGRNAGFAEKVKEFLKTGKTYFFVVGAAHMPGEKGILGLLKKEGYTIRQLPRAPGKKTGKQQAPKHQERI